MTRRRLEAAPLRPRPPHHRLRHDPTLRDAPGPGSCAAETTLRWRTATARRDVDAVVGLLAPGAVVHTPVTDRFVLRGPEEIRTLLTLIFTQVDVLDHHTDVGEGPIRILGLHGRIGEVGFEEVQTIDLDDSHQVVRAVFSVRPAAGVAALNASIGSELLAAHRGRAWRAALRPFLRAAARLVRGADRRVIVLAAPPDR